MRKKISLFLFLIILLIIAAAFLATWDIPTPISRIEKVIPNDRFQR